MKILVLPGDRGSAVHHRILQFLPELAAAGWSFEVYPIEPLSGMNHWERAQSQAQCMIPLISSNFDVVWIDKAVTERPLLWQLLKARMMHKCAYDPWAGPPPNPLPKDMHVLTSDGDTEGWENGSVFPWSVSVRPLDVPKLTQHLSLGWLGGTGCPKNWDILRKALAGIEPSRFLLYMTDKKPKGASFAIKEISLPTGNFHCLDHAWDLGVFPLHPGTHEDPLIELNLLRCMASGIPIIVSNIAPYARMVEDSRGGYVADDSTQWHHYLSKLLGDKELRQHLGRLGWEWVRLYRNKVMFAPQLLKVLGKVGGFRSDTISGPGLANKDDIGCASGSSGKSGAPFQ